MYALFLMTANLTLVKKHTHKKIWTRQKEEIGQNKEDTRKTNLHVVSEQVLLASKILKSHHFEERWLQKWSTNHFPMHLQP